MKFKDIKKYHINLFTANIFALVLAIFFIRSYISRGISIIPIYLIVLTLLIVFVLVSIFILKPLGKIKKLFPDKKIIVLNVMIVLIIGLLFFNQIGLLGLLFVLKFSFLLFQVEHIVYEGFKI